MTKLIELGGSAFGPGPTVGGGVLPIDPARAVAAGLTPNVPVMHGTTRDEHITFVNAIESMTGEPVTRQNYAEQVIGVFGKDVAAKVLARYPLGDEPPAVTLSTVLTDYTWGCPALQTDRLLAQHLPTYAYEFADRNAPWFREAATPDYPTGAYHAGELQYLFTRAYGTGQLSAAQQRLSDQMIQYWTRFARNGNPNGPGTPEWPQCDGNDVQSLAPGPFGIHSANLATEHQCGFWRSVTG